MSVLIKHMAMPKGCIYANDKDQTEYCPMLNHDDVPFCQYIENEPEAAIGIDERPVYCPLEEYPEPCEDAVSRQAAIDAIRKIYDSVGILGEKWAVDKCQMAIKDLPSAQPEIIRCRDCKYGELDDDDRWYCRSLGCQIGNEDGSGFCADAERRE